MKSSSGRWRERDINSPVMCFSTTHFDFEITEHLIVENQVDFEYRRVLLISANIVQA